MSDVAPDERVAGPWEDDPDETGLERRDAEGPGLSESEEDRPEPGAGNPTTSTVEAQSEVQSDEEPGLSADKPEDTPTAPLVAGHTADTSAIDEGDGTRRESGSPTATPLDAEREFRPDDAPVFDSESADSFRLRWSAILAEFIDDPHRAVEDADHFVADVAQAFASGVESRRQSLTSAWEHDGHDQTEELRLTMRQYGMLVDQLLTVAATPD
jgi:hypothetical protein